MLKLLETGLHGIDYVPVSFDIGSGSRTDTTAANDDDSGTRTASAELED